MANQSEDPNTAITWQRARAIFGNADSPAEVWERQFDYNDDDLKRIAATPYREIDRNDLWYYYHDLAYVELQPELFNYLFPVCLMEWHDTLMRDEDCAHGDAEFHYSLHKGSIFEKMLTAQQVEQVVDFFQDSLLQRIDAEPATVVPSLATHPFRWLCRFNSLGQILPCIERFWEPWWKLDTRGRAICVLQYCSGLIYFEGENKAFGIPFHNGQYGPFVWESDARIHAGWQPENIEFLRERLTFEYIMQKLESAAAHLLDTPEHGLALSMIADATSNHELLQSRISELPLLLSKMPRAGLEGWSI